MAYFPDMSPYVYFATGEEALNLGWLDEHHSFPTGDVDKCFLEKLFNLCTQRSVMKTRGFHVCPFCATAPENIGRDSTRLPSGSAEIRVKGKNGELYASPVLIYHFVQAHGYRPPEAHMEAVRMS